MRLFPGEDANLLRLNLALTADCVHRVRRKKRPRASATALSGAHTTSRADKKNTRSFASPKRERREDEEKEAGGKRNINSFWTPFDLPEHFAPKPLATCLNCHLFLWQKRRKNWSEKTPSQPGDSLATPKATSEREKKSRE